MPYYLRQLACRYKGYLEIAVIHSPHIRGIIGAIASSRWTNVRAVNLRSELNHTLVHHPAEESVSA